MPTIAGFILFIRQQMGITTAYLPDTAPVIAGAFAVALETVNLAIQQASCLMYSLAVYNLAADRLLNYASDVSITNSAISWALPQATVTTATPHGLTTGMPVLVCAAAPLAYNTDGTIGIVVIDASTYQYGLPVNPGTNTQPGTTSLTFFADLRKMWNLTGFTAGVIQASADEATSDTLLVPDAFKALTLGDLQNLRTPYGREYLAIAQNFGTLWGLS